MPPTDPKSPPPGGPSDSGRPIRKWWVLAAVGTGSFMAALDGSVVNTILPVIRDVFDSPVADVEWVVTTYLLVLSGLLLTFGRLGDLYGHRRIYLYGFGLFVAGSAVCGAAPSLGGLVAARALQAVGAAMLASNAPALLTRSFPAEQRGRALGLASAMTYAGLTVGPSLGGWLAHLLGWRSVFYINLPVGLLACGMSLAVLPHLPATESDRRFDLPGSLTFLAALTALLLGLNRGPDLGWGSYPVLASLAAGIGLSALFVFIERRSPAPMLDLALFRSPLFTASALNAVLNYICVYSITFLMPFYLIQGRGLDPASAGLLLTAQPVVMAIAAPVSGNFSDRIGSRWPGMIGMATLGLGLLLLSRLDPETPFRLVVLALAVAGLGTGTFISPNTSAMMGAAPRGRQGIAAGVLATSRNFGMVLGIGLAGAIFTTHLNGNEPAGLYAGIDAGFLATAAIAILGVLVSAVKER